MSSKRMSPTATLLRNSRLFSLPPPLPRPSYDFGGHVAANRLSDTATAPYPTQQAIATTPAALGRGDWGLKRSLPLRSTTNTSTPIFRINAVDTREHITDYDSASDLTLTLKKFQELNLPITTQASRAKASGSEPRISAFDAKKDNTDLKAAGQDGRWKYHGPWLAGMAQADFREYLDKKIGNRKEEFLVWLRRERIDELKRKARKEAMHEGLSEEEAVAEVQLSDEEFQEWIRNTRRDVQLGGDLATYIGRFFDLPLYTPLQAATDEQPPTTHPSAGLSYLKTDAFLENHPVWGPQARRRPVEARILVGTGSSDSRNRSGKVGVAGLVATAPDPRQMRSGMSGHISSIPNANNEEGNESYAAERGRERTGGTLGIDVDGGNRIWVEPQGATVDAKGRIDLRVANPEQVAVDVLTGNVANNKTAPQTRRTMTMPSLDTMSSRPRPRPRPTQAELSFEAMFSGIKEAGIDRR